MKQLLLPFLIAAMFTSCEKKTEIIPQETVQDTIGFVDEPSVTDSTLVATSGCYMQASGKDTLFVQLMDNLGTVTGKMHYKNFQKDSSFGDVMGSKDGDTIKLDYTFQSEGTTSTRQVWFLEKDGALHEGIGDLNAEGTGYSDPEKVKYEGGHVLQSADCNGFEKKLTSTTYKVDKQGNVIQ